MFKYSNTVLLYLDLRNRFIQTSEKFIEFLKMSLNIVLRKCIFPNLTWLYGCCLILMLDNTLYVFECLPLFA